MKLDKRLFRQLASSKHFLWLALGCGVAGAFSVVVQARSLSKVLNGVFLEKQSLRTVLFPLGLYALLALIRALCAWTSERALQEMTQRVKTQLRIRIATQALSRGPASLKNEQMGELVNTAMEGVESLDAWLRTYLPQLFLTGLIPIIFLVTVIWTDWTSALIFLFTAPLIPLFMALIGSLAAAKAKNQWLVMSRMSAHFLDVLRGLPTLKSFARGTDQLQRIAQVSDRFRIATLDVLRIAFLSALVLELISTLATAIIAVEIGLRLLYGKLDFETSFFVLILAPEFYSPFRALGSAFHASVAGTEAADRIFSFLGDQEPQLSFVETHAIPASTPSPVEPSAFSEGIKIEFRTVSYAYPGGSGAAVHHFSASLPQGKTVALMGRSGAGKTTLAHLLLRFIEPSAGEILVNGVPISNWEPAEWRKHVAWVPQNPHIFHGTVIENLRIARPDASLAEIETAARNANAHSFIEALPNGYQTLLGERGTNISGGQIQRIAIARAFLRNAPLLILDEATANLDPQNENEIGTALHRLRRGRTTLLIAHRLSTVASADQILIIDRGILAESGTPEQLIRMEGLFAKLAAAWEGRAFSHSS